MAEASDLQRGSAQRIKRLRSVRCLLKQPRVRDRDRSMVGHERKNSQVLFVEGVAVSLAVSIQRADNIAAGPKRRAAATTDL